MTDSQEIEKFILTFTESVPNVNRAQAYQKHSIPEKKRRNAVLFIAPEIEKGDIVFLVDDTVLGSAKHGLVFTTEKLYWDLSFDGKSRGSMDYQDVKDVTLTRKGVIINSKRISFLYGDDYRSPVQELLLAVRDEIRRLRRSARVKKRKAARQEPRTVIIQNIGEYVAGGEVNLQDCVVNRSQIGRMAGPAVEMTNRRKVMAEYRRLLEAVWADGVVTDEEFEFLARVRTTESIGLADHHRIEQEVIKGMQTRTQVYPCPACGYQLEYIKDYADWYCWKCEDYPYDQG